MADKVQFVGKNLLEELSVKVNEELVVFLKQKDAAFEWPTVRKTEKISHGDYTLVLSAVCGKKKINAVDFTKDLAEFLNKTVEADPNRASLLIKRVEPAGGYLNIWINRAVIFQKVIKAALNLGKLFGTLDVMRGKKVIVEHTSANPIGPLHIGNLRNVILGGVLAQILKSVGYDVKQHFYVNDLGFQIGLTAIGFVRVYDKLEPKLKIDQWIGMIYAMMNTFSEMQILGQELNSAYGSLIIQGIEPAAFVAQVKSQQQQGGEVNEEKLLEYSSIFKDLENRQPELFKALISECAKIPSIKKAAGELNLKYENNQPEAVKTFRMMVIACLSGIQETLDTYSIKHDFFDFESELGWEGSNDRVLTIMKASPYYVEPTQSNAEGKPEGGYFKLDQFIKDQGLPQGKKGYQPNYPNLYVLRPDYSTLYTYRDVVYSLKKVSNNDMVLNIIASEQNLAQEKVALALELLQPGEPRKQFHVSYELVKLVDKENKERKMSSRRGIYVLGDDIYDELKEVIQKLMAAKFAEKGKQSDPELFAKVTDEVATAAMKYALVSFSCRSKISFNIERVCSFEDSSAPFLLYNATRVYSLFRKHQEGVAAGIYPALPANSDEVDWTALNQEIEWELLSEFVLAFPPLIQHIACPPIPDAPALPEFPIHLLCDFLISLVRLFSKYWSGTKILIENPSAEQAKALVARLYLVKAVQLVLNNGLTMLTMTPLEKM